ncbi:MAG: HAMP domain-containing protein [Candidatus Omnitrophota bacterium]
MMRTRFIRVKFFTGGPVQLRYLFLLMVSMIVPVLFVGGCLYYLIFNVMAEQLGIPEYIAYNLFPVIQKINFVLLIGVPPLFLILMIWGIAMSHRFVGPMERLEREIRRISDSGDFSKRIRVRRRDDVRPVAEALNKLLDKIEGSAK